VLPHGTAVLSDGALLAVSDLHIERPENRRFVERMRPTGPSDWLIVCGDVADHPDRVGWALALLSERFARLIWVPGNHELLTYSSDPTALRGEPLYRHLVQICRELGVVTPEDPFPVWSGPEGSVRVAPLFLLYDYSFCTNVASTPAEAMRLAHKAGVVCGDEFLLDPAPFPDRAAWCRSRVITTEKRLEADGDTPTVLVNHFPLTVEPTRVLRHPEFAQWCGTSLTADWHRRFGTVAVVYGHLHIPRTTLQDGVRFEEVSLGYPREWQFHGGHRTLPRRILPRVERA
jgi:3',5'-cyclic AMP phosphodiesterase CpdA